MPPRACDACKGRKVKCDGSDSAAPCSNCRMSNLPCLYLQLPRKRGPKAQSASARMHNHRCGRRVSHREPITHDTSGIPFSPSDGSSPSLEIDYTLGYRSAATPWMVSTPQIDAGQRTTDLNVCIQSIHQDFILALSASMPTLSLEQIARSCIDYYMQNIFPIAPLVHEKSLRSSVALEAPLIKPVAVAQHMVRESNIQLSNVEDLARLRSYTSTTAICACAALLLPPEIIPNGGHVGLLFLRASREMLKLYQDSDIDHPNSSSLTIRICQAGVLHTDGKVHLAAQVFAEVWGLAKQMRLYDERSYDGLAPAEARLRRLAFWQLYNMDKYSAMLEDRPMNLNEFSLDGLLTTKCQDELDVRMIDVAMGGTPSDFEGRLLAGFYVCQKLWAMASEVLLDLQTLSRFCQRAENATMLVEAQRIDLTGTYLRFLSVLDDLPTHLHAPGAILSVNETEMGKQRECFWVQRTNLLVTYHCLKMFFLQRFMELGLPSLLGLSGDGAMLSLRKTEIANDLISVMTSVPFESLRANGEACVIKIRRVGVTLLEVMQQANAPNVASRAKSLFPLLLDVLAKLDSRASDELNEDYAV